MLTFQTDGYGTETSWFVRRDSDARRGGDDGDSGRGRQQYVGYGPPDTTSMTSSRYASAGGAEEEGQQQAMLGSPVNDLIPSGYEPFTLYSFSYCLDVGSTYTLAVEDNFGDGMCCDRGYGGYEYSLGGVRQYSTNLRPTFRDYVEHTFTVVLDYAKTRSPTDEPTGTGLFPTTSPPTEEPTGYPTVSETVHPFFDFMCVA